MTQESKQKKPINVLALIGNLFIALSLFGFIILLYPIVAMYLFPPVVKNEIVQKGVSITIPKIHAQAPIIENVDPWNEAEYQKALTKGVAHAKNTSLPGTNGTVFLFAHSSGPLWVNRYNTIFYRLGELAKNDPIYLTKDGVKITYRVVNKIEVWPSDVKYLEKNEKNQLILQTCTPIGTSLKRLLVFAEPDR